MPNPVERSACDRCHGQKLRCARPGRGRPCIRCAKGKAVCTLTRSIRGQSKQLSSKPPSLEQSSIATLSSNPTYDNGNGIDAMTQMNTSFPSIQTEFDFSALSTCPLPDVLTTVTWSGRTVDIVSGSSSAYALFNASLMAHPYLQSGDAASTSQHLFNQEWAMSSAEQQPPLEHGIVRTCLGTPKAKSQETQSLRLSTIHGLSDLNVERFTLSSTIPKPPTSISQPHSWTIEDFAIDKTFRLSQRLIEVLDELFPRNSKSNSCIMTPPQEAALPVLAPDDSLSFEQSSFMFVLSCYQRLIESYHDI